MVALILRLARRLVGREKYQADEQKQRREGLREKMVRQTEEFLQQRLERTHWPEDGRGRANGSRRERRKGDGPRL